MPAPESRYLGLLSGAQFRFFLFTSTFLACPNVFGGIRYSIFISSSRPKWRDLLKIIKNTLCNLSQCYLSGFIATPLRLALPLAAGVVIASEAWQSQNYLPQQIASTVLLLYSPA